LEKIYVGLSKRGALERRVDMTNRKTIIIGIVLSGLAALFLGFDALMKLVDIAPVREGMAKVGFPVDLARILGAILLACVALYINVRTAVLGAVLLTGYLGGAVATHVRIGDPLFSHVLAPVYMGVLIWGGLYLRDDRVRALVR
jgi:DoxX-like family